MRGIELKPREAGDLPPEKLLEILGGIWPKDVADELFEDLMGTKPREES